MECRHKYTICRLCLCGSECFVDIFQMNEWFGYVAAEVIRDLLQFQVSEFDGYPHVVCSICLGKLTDFKQFKEQCQNSRDAYNNVFASDESHGEYPADVVPSVFIKTEPEEGPNDVDSTTEVSLKADLDPENLEGDETITDDIPLQVELPAVKLEPEDPLDTQEVHQEIRKCGVPFASQEYLTHRQKRTLRESYGPHESGVNDGPCENIKSSGSANAEVGEMGVEVRRDCKSPCESVYVLLDEESDVNKVRSGVGELRSGTIKRREEVNYVETNTDAALGDGGALESKTGRNSETEGASERERGKEAPLGAQERKREYYRCNDCGEDLEKKDALIKHLRAHGYQVNGESGNEGRDLQVDINVNCGSKRKNTSLRRGPKRNTSDRAKRDEEARKYVCDLCGKCFNRRGKLEVHFRVHSGEKPFGCDICGKRFGDESNLRKHNLTHTGEKPYECEVCGIRFKQNYDLVIHRRTHSGEKPYECKICGKKFAQSGNLTSHVRVHSGEKPYKCEVCDKYFSVRSNLRKHLRIHSR